jgi:hypothetical protein
MPASALQIRINLILCDLKFFIPCYFRTLDLCHGFQWLIGYLQVTVVPYSLVTGQCTEYGQSTTLFSVTAQLVVTWISLLSCACCNIFSSHGSKYCALQSRRSRPTFQRCLLPPSSVEWVIALMMEAVRTSEMLVYFCKTNCNIPEGCHHQAYCYLLTQYTEVLYGVQVLQLGSWG